MKSGFVSIIGKPNVGKSTLLNCIIGEKIAITSKRPQTTRTKIIGILNEEDCQIVFFDTPGIHEPKNKLDDAMKKNIKEAKADGDLVLHIVDKLENIEHSLGEVLVLNKVDTLDKEKILPYLHNHGKLYKEIFCISAKTGVGVKELLDYIKSKMPDGERFFPDDEITTQPERVLMAEYIREQAFRLLGDEIPFGTAVVIDKMKINDKNILEVDAVIYCEKERHKGIIIGKNGSKLKEIASLARSQGERFFGKKIFLQIRVKPAENWRDNDILIKNFLGGGA